MQTGPAAWPPLPPWPLWLTAFWAAIIPTLLTHSCCYWPDRSSCAGLLVSPAGLSYTMDGDVCLGESTAGTGQLTGWLVAKRVPRWSELNLPKGLVWLSTLQIRKPYPVKVSRLIGLGEGGQHHKLIREAIQIRKSFHSLHKVKHAYSLQLAVRKMARSNII